MTQNGWDKGWQMVAAMLDAERYRLALHMACKLSKIRMSQSPPRFAIAGTASATLMRLRKLTFEIGEMSEWRTMTSEKLEAIFPVALAKVGGKL